MHTRTSLPMLLATILTWTIGAAGCGGTGGGGEGGTGAATASGGNDGTGGTSASGGNTGTGGTSASGGNTGTGAGLPACESDAPLVLGCIVATTPDGVQPNEIASAGVVTAVRAPAADEPCLGSMGRHFGGKMDGPPTMIDLAMPDGSAITVGFDVPGLETGSIAVGETLELDFEYEPEPEGGHYALLRLARAGALVVAVGDNMPAELEPTEGASECYSENDECGHSRLTMQFDTPAGSVAIESGTSAQVGSLLVTNDRYVEHYDTSGGCNFGISVEYLMSAVPVP